MLHGPWKDATSRVLTLHVDDNNANREAIAIALAYLYGNYPKLDDSNAFRVLVVASFLDLQVVVFLCISFWAWITMTENCAILILDPHYAGGEDLKKIVNGVDGRESWTTKEKHCSL